MNLLNSTECSFFKHISTIVALQLGFSLLKFQNLALSYRVCLIYASSYNKMKDSIDQFDYKHTYSNLAIEIIE